MKLDDKQKMITDLLVKARAKIRTQTSQQQAKLTSTQKSLFKEIKSVKQLSPSFSVKGDTQEDKQVDV